MGRERLSSKYALIHSILACILIASFHIPQNADGRARPAKTFRRRLLPAPLNGGFRMNDYWVWCGSVVKGEDGRFHMFASRWPRGLSFSPHWLTNSEIVRAVSDKPEGPYVRLTDKPFDIGIGAEDPTIWYENGQYRALMLDTGKKYSDKEIIYAVSKEGRNDIRPCLRMAGRKNHRRAASG
jgi:hypothetical protein